MKNLKDYYLYSTCAGETFGKIDNQYTDENGCDVIDITVYDINNILFFQNNISPESENYNEEFESYRTRCVLPDGVEAKILGCGYKISESKDIGWDGKVENLLWASLNMPSGGCYRCSQFFLLKKES